MRRGEAIALDRADVDLADGVLHVRANKQNKHREVPLHTSHHPGAARVQPRCATDTLTGPTLAGVLRLPQGGRLTGGAFNATFAKLIRQIGLEGEGQRVRPRAHDLRHSFAVRTLIDWYQADERIDAKLPLLATYLGHVDPASSYWYLEASPELRALVRERLERAGGPS